MSRYIDADELIRHLNHEIQYGVDIDIHPVEFGTYLGLISAKSFVKDAPTADVQEVVRCKECKYAIEGDVVFGYCRKHGIHCLSETDFCSYGERRKGDGTIH